MRMMTGKKKLNNIKIYINNFKFEKVIVYGHTPLMKNYSNGEEFYIVGCFFGTIFPLSCL